MKWNPYDTKRCCNSDDIYNLSVRVNNNTKTIAAAVAAAAAAGAGSAGGPAVEWQSANNKSHSYNTLKGSKKLHLTTDKATTSTNETHNQGGILFSSNTVPLGSVSNPGIADYAIHPRTVNGNSQLVFWKGNNANRAAEGKIHFYIED